jgi:hypothetical protein
LSRPPSSLAGSFRVAVVASRFAALVSLAATPAAGCRRSSGAPADGGTDGVGADGPTPITLAVAVTGCGTYAVSGGIGNCVGDPPLELAFAPVSSSDFVRFSWSFGDGTPDVQDPAPTHRYNLPGTYTVLLTGVLGANGTVQTSAVIDVRPLPVGGACDLDAHCASGLTCTCQPGGGCAVAFVKGICSVSCETAPCPTGGVCASFALGPAPTDGTGVPRAPTCLASCDGGCPAGFVCTTLAGAGPAASDRWVRACVPAGALADLGAPCRNANGDLDDEICGTGVCADLGALGVCSAACDGNQPCPTNATCATLADGAQWCLTDCATAGACVRDPLLACAAPNGGATSGGFQADAAAGLSFCVPKPCGGDAECAPSGRCAPTGDCVRK